MNLRRQEKTTMPMKSKWHEKNKKEEATNSEREGERERNVKIQWKLKTSEIKWFGANICACACDSFLFTANALRLLCAHNSMGFYVYLPSLHYDFMLFSRQSTLLPLLCCRYCRGCCCCCSCCLFGWTWCCYCGGRGATPVQKCKWRVEWSKWMTDWATVMAGSVIWAFIAAWQMANVWPRLKLSPICHNLCKLIYKIAEKKLK